jgi:hypothetical protein
MDTKLPPPTDKDLRTEVVKLVLAFHRDGQTGANTTRIMEDITKIYDFITKFVR